MVAIAANDGLKARRQKAGVFGLQRFRANGTSEQIRENPGQAKHPYFEITVGEIDRAALLQRPDCHSNEPEDRILRLMLRQKTVD